VPKLDMHNNTYEVACILMSYVTISLTLCSVVRYSRRHDGASFRESELVAPARSELISFFRGDSLRAANRPYLLIPVSLTPMTRPPPNHHRT
jgi:hypothetical protein